MVFFTPSAVPWVSIEEAKMTKHRAKCDKGAHRDDCIEKKATLNDIPKSIDDIEKNRSRRIDTNIKK